MANVVITISGNDTDRYKLLTNTKILGRQYDNAAENIVINRPESEADSVCVMVVKDKFGNLIDRVIFDDTNTYPISSNISQYNRVQIGFAFTRNDGYIKNSEVLDFKFEAANKPTDFIPVPPEQQAEVDYLLDHGFTGVTISNNRLTFTGSDGQVVATIDLSAFVEAQADFAENDPASPAYIKDKKTSFLQNDGDGVYPFVTKAVNDLLNYYLKSETYTKAEVNAMFGQLSLFRVEIVQALPQEPQTLVLYLVPKAEPETNDNYDEYLWIGSAWERIGSAQIDLSNYYTKSETDTLLGNKVDKVEGKGLSQNDLTDALKSGYDTAATNAHTHANKAILDSVTEAFTTELKAAYDGAVTDKHTHSNKSILDDIEVALTSALKSAYDGAVANEHKHSNKAILDATEESYTTADKTAFSGKQDALSSAQLDAVNSGIDSTKVGKIGTNETAIGTINEKIPAEATSSNKLADKAFVNSSISTATATFRGTYNVVSDLGLTISATEAQIAAALDLEMQSQSITPTNNDYCFVAFPDETISTQYTKYDRYKYDGTVWEYEFTLNNSSFTAQQWAAINSGITGVEVSQIGTNATNIASLQSGKQDKISATNKLNADYIESGSTNVVVTQANLDAKQNAINSGNKVSADFVDDTSTTHKFVAQTDINNWNAKQDTLTFDSAPTQNSDNPVKSGGVYTALQAKQNTLTSASITDGTVDKAVGFDSQGNLIKGAITGGDGGFYMCTYESTSFQAVSNAITANLIPVCIFDGYLFTLGKIEGSGANTVYYFFNSAQKIDKQLSLNTSNTWGNNYLKMMINPFSATGDIVYSSNANGEPVAMRIGTTGQVLTVGSNGTPEWATPSSGGMTNPMEAEGDIIYGGSSGTPTRLAKGTAGQVLKMNSGGTAPEWANESGGGIANGISYEVI